MSQDRSGTRGTGKSREEIGMIGEEAEGTGERSARVDKERMDQTRKGQS
jgi:hypothetical protein